MFHLTYAVIDGTIPVCAELVPAKHCGALAGNHNTYERAAMTEWIEKHGTSPLTGATAVISGRPDAQLHAVQRPAGLEMTAAVVPCFKLLPGCIRLLRAQLSIVLEFRLVPRAVANAAYHPRKFLRTFTLHLTP